MHERSECTNREVADSTYPVERGVTERSENILDFLSRVPLNGQPRPSRTDMPS